MNKGKRAGKLHTIKISISPTSTRASSLIHLYSKKYYETRVKHHVDLECHGADLDPDQRIAVINKCTARAFENESEAVKKEIALDQVQDKKNKESQKEIEKQLANDGASLNAEQLML